MSHLVTDFLINPVLRQARRFSSARIEHHIVPITNQPAAHDGIPPPSDEAISETSEPIGIDLAEGGEGSDYGRPTVSSPVEEDGAFDTELAAWDRSQGAAEAVAPSSAVPRRLTSTRSGRMSLDSDASDNPSFGIPNHFQTASPMSASFSSSTHIRRVNPANGSRRSTEENPQPLGLESTARHRNSPLPEDDGMTALRRRIITIQAMDVTATDKARLMHQLLTEGYSQSQISLHAKAPPRTYSPASIMSQEGPTTPGSLTSFGFWQAAASGTPPESSPSSSNHAFYISQDDLRPTYAPMNSRPVASSDSGESDDNEPIQSLGCRHYKRNVKLQCFACSRWHTCRFCHDEVEDHALNRKETRNMLCMLCGCAQIAADTCANCGVRAARFYCGVCKLWDDDANKSIYHCYDCGICRVGRGIGKDFIHCKTCGVCVSIASENSHKCIERASDCDCPICGEYLFSSPQSVVFMRCGHSIHRTCYDALMKTSYKCPICSQSIVNMETQFRNLDRAIESQPMPSQFQDTKAMVSCNDCYAKSLVKYHWLGLKCAICDSYNTAQLQILSDPEIDVPMMEVETHNSHFDQSAANIPSISHQRFSSIVGPPRSRRHSSHTQPASLARTDSLQFSPYNIPQRLGRSVSPFRPSELSDHAIFARLTHHAVESDGEDDIEFWGGDAPRSIQSEEDFMEDCDSEELSTASNEEADDDDADEDDHMELFGHR